jgi:MFS family permease
LAYALSGGLAAVCALYLAFAPASAWTYGIGYSGYALAAGFAYAVFTALVLEVLGRRRHAAGTAYSLLVSSGNLPILYMTWLDGFAYKHGVPGSAVKSLMTTDAVANGGVALLLLGVANYARHRWKRWEEDEVDVVAIAP